MSLKVAEVRETQYIDRIETIDDTIVDWIEFVEKACVQGGGMKYLNHLQWINKLKIL